MNTAMKKLLEVTLGTVTSIGGFLEVGSLATAAQAGAMFGMQLTWAIALGGLCMIFLVEMSGRFAAVSKHTWDKMDLTDPGQPRLRCAQEELERLGA